MLRRPLSGLQFLGALLIVISIGVAKTPDILQIINPQISDEAVIANISNQNVTNSAGSNSNVNAIPLTAIILALVASFNSGTILETKISLLNTLSNVSIFLF